jgi:hypothetical protein
MMLIIDKMGFDIIINIFNFKRDVGGATEVLNLIGI